MQTHDLKGAELMTTGDPDGRGINFSIEDLQTIADAFRALGLRGRVPLKFGHDSEKPIQDGQPALGWIDSLWVEGNRLMANFTGMPTAVYNAIKAGLYKFVSVELLRDVQAGTRKIPWVLDAVALLGADQPAFGTLDDLQKLLATRRTQPALRAQARYSYSRGAFNFSTSPEVRHMDEAAVQAAVAKALEPVKLEFTTKLTKLETDHSAAMARKDQELKDQAIKFKREQIDAVFNAAIASKDIVPAVRVEFEALTGIDKNPARVVDVDVTTAQKFVKDHPNPDKPKGGMGTRAGGGDEETGTPIERVSKRAEKIALTRSVKLTDGPAMAAITGEVLRADKKLATAYFDDRNGEAA